MARASLVAKPPVSCCYQRIAGLPGRPACYGAYNEPILKRSDGWLTINLGAPKWDCHDIPAGAFWHQR